MEIISVSALTSETERKVSVEIITINKNNTVFIFRADDFVKSFPLICSEIVNISSDTKVLNFIFLKTLRVPKTISFRYFY